MRDLLITYEAMTYSANSKRSRQASLKLRQGANLTRWSLSTRHWEGGRGEERTTHDVITPVRIAFLGPYSTGFLIQQCTSDYIYFTYTKPFEDKKLLVNAGSMTHAIQT